MPLVDIVVNDPWKRVASTVAVSLRVTVSRPANGIGSAFVLTRGLWNISNTVRIANDMLTQRVELRPGESMALESKVTFHHCGGHDLSEFHLSVEPESAQSAADIEVVSLPSHPFRVVPSLERALSVELTRVCGYDDAVKVEVVVTNADAASDIADIVLTVADPHSVRHGPLCRRIPKLRPREAVSFDLVVVGGELELNLAATVSGERIESRRTLSIPKAGADDGDRTSAPFAFLEPRAFTNDRITLVPEGKNAETTADGGIFPVHGGKSRYVLTVYPSNPNAASVRLYAAAGRVEVEALTRKGKESAFVITVVENPTLTQLVRLDYDVQVHGSPLRGELYLSIRPSAVKLWGVALTAGIALTVKGFASLGPSLFRTDLENDSILENVGELFSKRWDDIAQLLAIPLCCAALWTTDRLWRTFHEE